MKRRKITEITQGNGQHWVGDGFPVNNMLSYATDTGISPFLLLDYAKPTNFPPSSLARGVAKQTSQSFYPGNKNYEPILPNVRASNSANYIPTKVYESYREHNNSSQISRGSQRTNGLNA